MANGIVGEGLKPGKETEYMGGGLGFIIAGR